MPMLTLLQATRMGMALVSVSPTFVMAIIKGTSGRAMNKDRLNIDFESVHFLF